MQFDDVQNAATIYGLLWRELARVKSYPDRQKTWAERGSLTFRAIAKKRSAGDNMVFEDRKKRHSHHSESRWFGFSKARTRQLIQLGGLVVKAGYLDLLNVPAGGNMERDYIEEASTILGLLVIANDDLAQDRNLKENWRAFAAQELGGIKNAAELAGAFTFKKNPADDS